MPVIYQGGGSSSGSVNIPELYSDPVSPTSEETWVRATPISNVGQPIGLLLSLTYAQTTYSYQLSYRTVEGTTVRTNLA